jgi:hypothetical protein
LIRDGGRAAAGTEADAARATVSLTVDTSGVAAGVTTCCRTTGNAHGVAAAHRDTDSRLTAARFGGGHFVFADRALVLAKLLFEIEVGAGRRISNVL